MNLLLNASNLKRGGGKTAVLQLIHAVAPLRPDDKLYVIAPRKSGFEELTRHPNVALLPLPDSFNRSLLSKLRHMHFIFPKWCDRLRIDKVISLGNVAFPARGRPHAVYIQLPQLVYHESPAWKMMNMSAFLRNSLLDQYVALHMRYASSFAVQTEVMRSRLIARFKLPEEGVHVIPSAAMAAEHDAHRPLPEPRLPLKLIFLSGYHPHKQFECLPELARLLEERKVPVQITLTINKTEGPGAAAVLHALRHFNNIRNIGPIPLSEVGKALDEHHGIFMPSLMESFSGAYAEAVQHRRLIFTSHYDFATELLGEAAFYFDPLKVEHIASVLQAVAENDSLIEEKLAALEHKAASSHRLQDVGASFSRIIDHFA